MIGNRLLLHLRIREQNEGPAAEFLTPIKHKPEPSTSQERLQNEFRRSL